MVDDKKIIKEFDNWVFIVEPLIDEHSNEFISEHSTVKLFKGSVCNNFQFNKFQEFVKTLNDLLEECKAKFKLNVNV
jgi:hypothetical protein